MNPDPKHHNPDPDYLRSLVAQIGLSQRQIAKSLDINESQFRAYLVHSEKSSHRECPYVVQYALEKMNNLSGLERHREDGRKERIENIKVGDEYARLKYQGKTFKIRRVTSVDQNEMKAYVSLSRVTGSIANFVPDKDLETTTFQISAIEDYRPRKNHAD